MATARMKRMLPPHLWPTEAVRAFSYSQHQRRGPPTPMVAGMYLHPVGTSSYNSAFSFRGSPQANACPSSPNWHSASAASPRGISSAEVHSHHPDSLQVIHPLPSPQTSPQ